MANLHHHRERRKRKHLSVIGVVCLLNEWEFLPSQCLEDGHHLSKHPRLVTEVVNRLQRVDAGEACVLHANDQVAEVFILCHAKCMLSDEHKVWSEGPDNLCAIPKYLHVHGVGSICMGHQVKL